MRLLMIALLLVGLALLPIPFAATPVHATPIVLDISATTCTGCSTEALPNVTIHAEITVQPATGPHWDAFFASYIAGPYLDVLAITGSLNIDGSGPFALSLIPTPVGEPSSPSWLHADDPAYLPGLIWFSAEGFNPAIRIIDDHPIPVFQGAIGTVAQVPLRWFASVHEPAVPEPAMIILMACALLAVLGMSAWRYARHRGLTRSVIVKLRRL